MTDLTKLTVAEARDGLRAKTFTAPELAEAYLAAIDQADALNAYVHKTPEIARSQAGFAQTRLNAGMSPDLCGIPLGIKDLFCTEGVPSQAASRILAGFKPPYESTVTTQLHKQGAVMLGKLNMDEFAMGSSNETSCYGNAVNPWRRGNDGAALTPGGSSGGSAAAVAADLCAAATGTDTGGSIRQPAAFVGITGIKPTYGRVSRWGIIAFASSLDQAGPMTKDVRDAAIMLRAMSGHDPKDSTSADIPVPDFEAMLTGDIRGKVIGIPREYRMDGMPEEIEALWAKGREMLQDAGAEIRDISLPHTKYALPCYYVIAPPRRPPTSPATTASASATVPSSPKATASPTCTRRPAPRASAPRSSAASWSGPTSSRPASTTPITTAPARSAPSSSATSSWPSRTASTPS
ncbi:Aspartyl-tRNA(Asn) amidotransferase subunit A / Glutamyl-tRNA(Gln) amidotransferase subunit A [Rubellimicrobium mesophilum DSM 19309]|uniref:Aspartyl-tRNA(Asn) amidotransferase subunit A / Glutamyl-tRNA(Gln) amidotransferase subunit A n=1 Tax=Rubellimicrobium mesophilum DSM 19309 TaxID=442562 RepID=A0A017HRX4_9RHOB|nr:Aspartyl-tRNA(Asn) amidotransferase subunit A / Glutamyl-tRNA(Gln) amidotransferase subunit A [Rubellimicrobium mesophilum DSM 19309]